MIRENEDIETGREREWERERERERRRSDMGLERTEIILNLEPYILTAMTLKTKIKRIGLGKIKCISENALSARNR